MKNSLISFLFLIAFYPGQAQEQQRLLSIDGNPVYKSEFERVFKKNLDLVKDRDKQDVEKYLELFINYKLKVLEAEEEGLDTIKSFRAQYDMYKSQLAQKYMMDTKVSDRLLHQAYERLQEEVRASHILVRLAPNAPPQDTLKAYQKIENIRDKLINGGSFEKIAIQYSEDPSARSNKGDVGWFGVFNTVYPFENAAYKTKKGEVSQPVRTEFGYHVLTVTDKRKDKGKVGVAQIFIKFKEGSSGTEAKKRIDKIYKKLKKGANFADMARQYSEDKATASKGGKLKAFKRGSLRSKKFEAKAFGLTDKHPLSKPFKTSNGWRIIKLLEHHPVKSFADERQGLKKRIKKDGRSQMIKDSLIKKLNQEYSLVESEPGLAFFKDRLGENFIEKATAALPQKNMISINGEGQTYEDFLKILKSHKRRYRRKSITARTLDVKYAKFKEDYLMRYRKTHYAEISPDYAGAIKDYRSGLLIFALMEKKVWNKAKEDSVGLRKFYDQHRADFQAPTTYNGFIVSTDDKKSAKTIRRALKNGSEVEAIEQNHPEAIITSGQFKAGDPKLPKNFRRKPGVSKVSNHNGLYLVMKTKSVQPNHQQSFEEAKGKVISAYQDELEEELIEKLKAKHHVDVNQKTVNLLREEFE